MKFIDQNFLQQELLFQGTGYLPFIEWSISEIARENINILNIYSTEVFWLFSYIKNNFRSTLAQFYNYDIENDIFGFPTVQRELRHSIEAFLDLNNLVADENYKNVLLYCSNSNKKERNKIELGKYEKFLHKDEFTIQSKYNISGLDEKKLMKMSRVSNSYTHPDVCLDINKIRNTKEDLLIGLIKMNVFLISKAYDLFIKGIKAFGASVNLLNNYVWVNASSYSYENLHQQKRTLIKDFVKRSLIINQPTPKFNSYML